MKTNVTKHPVFSALKKRHESVTRDWAEQARGDKEYGGKDFETNLRRAKSVIDRFGNQTLKQRLNESGMGNDPELLRFVVKIAKELERTQRSGKTDPKDWGKVFYPNFPNP